MKRRGHTAGNADARYAGVVAECDTRTALASVKLIETRGGLELALTMEKAMQARCSVMGAINQRLGEVLKCGSAGSSKVRGGTLA